MIERDFSKLSRDIEDMPSNVLHALEIRGLVEAYRARPAYQQNDYLSWIRRAKRPETKQKRLDQMLRELVDGDRYMNMPWKGR